MKLHDLCNQWFKGNRWYASDNSREICASTKAAALREIGHDEKWFETNGTIYKAEDHITFKLTGTHPYNHQTQIQVDDLSNEESLSVGDLILIGKLLRTNENLR